ncbi:MAG: lysophospholipid acyltransferase family protein [Bacteroidales bacterium]|nr:lysophospholipid acyltransferase family protein [Bacteroidales bacterium]
MKYLFRIYQWLFAAPIILVSTILTSLFTIVASLFNRAWAGYYCTILWGKIFCWLFFVKVKVEGRENIDKKTSYVFVANHQGAYDIFALSGFLGHNFCWMMRRGLTNIPIVGTACHMAGHILVDTRSAESLKKTMDSAKKRLSKGVSLCVFPEGRRTDTGKMGQFKNGAFKLAVDFNLPVVPITIDGSYDVMPRSTFNIKPGTIRIIIHKPIEPAEGGHDLRNLSRDSYEAIHAALPEKYQ